MIKGIGVDLVKIERFNEVGIHFIERVLTKEEQLEYFNSNNKITYLASRFALKEAYFKASQDIHYLRQAFLNDERGKPYALNQKNIHLSLSHEDEYCIAYLIIEE